MKPASSRLLLLLLLFATMNSIMAAAVASLRKTYRYYISVQLVRIERYRCRVAYDGTRFKGWQSQLKHRTVQGTLNDVISARFGGGDVSSLGASRTDTGVHAIGQSMHFDAPRFETDVPKLEAQLNRMLPEDVRIYELKSVPQPAGATELYGWHAIASCTGKRYVYRLHASERQMNPLERLYRAKLAREPLDLVLFQAALQEFVGTHDFAGFANIKQVDRESGKNTVRTVKAAFLTDEGAGDLTVVVELDGALYKMVRNLVGSAAAVASGEITMEDLKQYLALAPPRETNKSKAAPAHGLHLDEVFYPHDDDKLIN